jgi:hypothetical protein
VLVAERPADLPDEPAARRAESARLVARIRELRRHLDELPPHHGAGGRDALTERIGALEARLRRLRG